MLYHSTNIFKEKNSLFLFKKSSIPEQKFICFSSKNKKKKPQAASNNKQINVKKHNNLFIDINLQQNKKCLY